MKAIELTAFGGPENFRESDLPIPEPRPGQVRIRIHAAAFNPVDYKIRRDGYGLTPPLVLGHDAAGVVHALGKGVKGFVPGDRVFAFLGPPRSNGSYAQYACIDRGFVAPMPSSLSFPQAAAVPVAGLTAYECIFRKARPRPRSSVFVAGGAGGVGSLAIPLLRHLGADPIITTAGSEASARYLLDHLHLSHENILYYKGLSLDAMRDAVLRMNSGRPVPVAYDFVGRDMKALCAAVSSLEGHVVSIVSEPDDFTMGGKAQRGDLFRHSASFHCEFLLARATLGSRRDWKLYRKELDALSTLISSGVILPPHLTVLGDLSLETVRLAHQQLEEGHTKGKLVVLVP